MEITTASFSLPVIAGSASGTARWAVESALPAEVGGILVLGKGGPMRIRGVPRTFACLIHEDDAQLGVKRTAAGGKLDETLSWREECRVLSKHPRLSKTDASATKGGPRVGHTLYRPAENINGAALRAELSLTLREHQSVVPSIPAQPALHADDY